MKYLAIPEPHIWDKNISARTNYVTEIKEYLNEVRGLAINLKSNDDVTLLWMGDIFHRDIQNKEEALYWYAWFAELRIRGIQSFSLIGNHEISYIKDNLFWQLVCKNECTLENDMCKPKGKLPLIRIVDRIDDGDLSIHFYHHGSKLGEKRKYNKYNIGLFHDSIVDVATAKQMKESLGIDLKIEFYDSFNLSSLESIKSMNLALIGHMHQARYKIRVGSTVVQYMASLGDRKSVV